MTRRPRPLATLFALALVALSTTAATAAAWAAPDGTTVPGPTVPASQVAGRMGNVELQDTDGNVIRSGDGFTVFLVHLPADATCPGDSANDQWRWNSFLIPIDEDPLQLVFSSTGPEPAWTANRYPLFDNAKQMPLAVQFLRRNPAPGSPGIIGAIPQASFLVQSQNQFQGGHYRLGIACTYFNQTTQYWDVAIDFSDAVTNKPSALTWSLPDITPEEVASANQAKSSSSSSSTVVIVAIGVAALLALIVLRVRAARNRTQNKES